LLLLVPLLPSDDVDDTAPPNEKPLDDGVVVAGGGAAATLEDEEEEELLLLLLLLPPPNENPVEAGEAPVDGLPNPPFCALERALEHESHNLPATPHLPGSRGRKSAVPAAAFNGTPQPLLPDADEPNPPLPPSPLGVELGTLFKGKYLPSFKGFCDTSWIHELSLPTTRLPRMTCWASAPA